MSADTRKNFAYSTVLTAPSPASSGTSLVVQSGDGAKFPATPFNAVIWPSGSQSLSTNAEIVRVTNITGDTLTITRTQESTSARTILVGDQIAQGITQKMLDDIEWIDNISGGNSMTVPANKSMYIPDYYEVTTGDTLEIAAAGVLEIG